MTVLLNTVKILEHDFSKKKKKKNKFFVPDAVVAQVTIATSLAQEVPHAVGAPQIIMKTLKE